MDKVFEGKYQKVSYPEFWFVKRASASRQVLDKNHTIHYVEVQLLILSTIVKNEQLDCSFDFFCL